MHTSTPRRRLRIPIDDRTLTVEVDGDEAVLRVAPCAAPPDTDASDTDASDTDAPDPLRVPARALVAALRVAWADEHDLRCFEPWRDVSRDGRWRGYEPDEDRYGYRYGSGSSLWWDDLGDGDPDGYRDPTVVPFRMPPPPPRPARAGQPWERHEEDELRALWLTASPEADRADLVRQIAQTLERPEGGLFVRLQVVGCDPTRPGRRRYEVDDAADEPVDLEELPTPPAERCGQRGGSGDAGGGEAMAGGTTR